MTRLIRRVLTSVRVRVTAAALIAVACALGVSAIYVEGSLQHDRQNVLMTTAQQDAHEVIDFNPELSTPIDLPTDATLQGGLVQVDGNGKTGEVVLAASKLLREEPPLWQPGDPEVSQNSYSFYGQATDVHVVAVPETEDHHKDVVVVVTSLDQYDHSLAYVRGLLDVGMPVLLAVVGLICWIIVGRALRPIEALRREVTEVAGIPGSHRVAEPATDDEVGRLARTLNSMLDRIEASSARERRFVSDASHELRTPIANIRTEIEVALHHPQKADWHSVAYEVLAQNQRMGRLVEELLLLARSDEGSLPRASGVTDLAEVATTVAAAAGTDPDVVLHAEPTPVNVPGVYLERIVSNLVDNARRFATSRVDVEVVVVGGFAILRVSDDGTGVPVDDRGRIFERFVRLDPARVRDEGGFGLGLAIVNDLCQAYGAVITVEDAPSGSGAMFVVRFPLSPQPLPPRELKPAGAV